MPNHLNEGQLRAALDGELDADEARHLESCADCLERKRLVHDQIRQAANRLDFLAGAASRPDPAVDARIALDRFYNRKLNYKETPMLKRLFASSALRFGLAVVLLLTVILTIPTTRALADQLLNLFRVQQVAVVPIDFTGMQQLTGQGPVGLGMSRLLSDSVTITQKPGRPQQVADAAGAGSLAGFPVRLPANMTASQITVTNGAAAFTFKINRAKAQALLDEAGRSDLLLPEAIDGQDISVTIPAGVSASYGTCPAPTSDEAERETGGGSPGRLYADCILLAQIPSPTVSAPAEVDVSQLARIGLEFTGMTPAQAAAFTDSIDWTTTLVIPVPKNAATYQQIPVDGVTGTLIQRPSDEAPQFSLIWVKGGIIYAISGLGTNADKAIEMANSLQ